MPEVVVPCHQGHTRLATKLYRSCTRTAPVLWRTRGCFGAIPSLYRACTGAVLGCIWAVSGLYRCCTGAVPEPHRGHAGTITAKCIRLAQKPAPGLYGVGASAVPRHYRPGANDLPHGCTGAVPELYRGRAGALPLNLHGCPLLVSVLLVFPLPTVAPLLLVSWCSGGVNGCPRVTLAVLVLFLRLSVIFLCGCPCAVATAVLLLQWFSFS